MMNHPFRMGYVASSVYQDAVSAEDLYTLADFNIIERNNPQHRLSSDITDLKQLTEDERYHDVVAVSKNTALEISYRENQYEFSFDHNYFEYYLEKYSTKPFLNRNNEEATFIQHTSTIENEQFRKYYNRLAKDYDESFDEKVVRSDTLDGIKKAYPMAANTELLYSLQAFFTENENERQNTLQMRLHKAFGFWFEENKQIEGQPLEVTHNEKGTFLIQDNKMGIYDPTEDKIQWTSNLEDIFQEINAPMLIDFLDQAKKEGVHLTNMEDIKNYDNTMVLKYFEYLLEDVVEKNLCAKANPGKVEEKIFNEYARVFNRYLEQEGMDIFQFLKAEKIMDLEEHPLEENKDISFYTINGYPLDVLKQDDHYYQLDLKDVYLSDPGGKLTFFLTLPMMEQTKHDITGIKSIDPSGLLDVLIENMKDMDRRYRLDPVGEILGSKEKSFFLMLDEKLNNKELSNEISLVRNALREEYLNGKNIWLDQTTSGTIKDLNQEAVRRSRRLDPTILQGRQSEEKRMAIQEEVEVYDRPMPSFDDYNRDMFARDFKDYLKQGYLDPEDNKMVYHSAANLSKDLMDLKWEMFLEGSDVSLDDLYIELYGGEWSVNEKDRLSVGGVNQDLWRVETSSGKYILYDHVAGEVPEQYTSELRMVQDCPGFQITSTNEALDQLLDLSVADQIYNSDLIKECSQKSKELFHKYQEASTTYNLSYPQFGKIKRDHIGGELVTEPGKKLYGQAFVQGIQSEYAKNMRVELSLDDPIAKALLQRSPAWNFQENRNQETPVVVQKEQYLKPLDYLKNKYLRQENILENRQALQQNEKVQSLPSIKNWKSDISYLEHRMDRALTNDEMFTVLGQYKKDTSMGNYRHTAEDLKIYKHQRLDLDSYAKAFSNQHNKTLYLASKELYGIYHHGDKTLNDVEVEMLVGKTMDYLTQERKIGEDLIVDVNRYFPSIGARKGNIAGDFPTLTFVSFDDLTNIVTGREDRPLTNQYFKTGYLQKDLFPKNLTSRELASHIIPTNKFQEMSEEDRSQYKKYTDYSRPMEASMYQKLTSQQKEDYRQLPKSLNQNYLKYLQKAMRETKTIDSKAPKGFWNTAVGEIQSNNLEPQHKKLIITEGAIDALSIAELLKTSIDYPAFKENGPFTNIDDIHYERDEIRLLSLSGVGSASNFNLAEYISNRSIPAENVYIAMDSDAAGQRAMRELKKQLPSAQVIGIKEQFGKDPNDALICQYNYLETIGLNITKDRQVVDQAGNILPKELLKEYLIDGNSLKTQEYKNHLDGYQRNATQQLASFLEHFELNMIQDPRAYRRVIRTVQRESQASIQKMKENGLLNIEKLINVERSVDQIKKELESLTKQEKQPIEKETIQEKEQEVVQEYYEIENEKEINERGL